MINFNSFSGNRYHNQELYCKLPYQLIYIDKGFGRVSCGATVEDFGSGHVLLLPNGVNLQINGVISAGFQIGLSEELACCLLKKDKIGKLSVLFAPVLEKLMVGVFASLPIMEAGRELNEAINSHIDGLVLKKLWHSLLVHMGLSVVLIDEPNWERDLAERFLIQLELHYLTGNHKVSFYAKLAGGTVNQVNWACKRYWGIDAELMVARKLIVAGFDVFGHPLPIDCMQPDIGPRLLLYCKTCIYPIPRKLFIFNEMRTSA